VESTMLEEQRRLQKDPVMSQALLDDCWTASGDLAGRARRRLRHLASRGEREHLVHSKPDRVEDPSGQMVCKAQRYHLARKVHMVLAR